ncbi:MAG TPA: hypothetical protein VFB80_22565 [Pirellulaceae bacterium]|nr:hypothetical protein [Pirellulaceae bacterium]
MTSPGQAILWQIYWRARWGLAAAAAFLLLAVALTHLLPRHWTIQMDEMDVSAVGWFFGVSCLFANFIVMAAFSMSSADARNLTFTKHMFVLPVRTGTLVAWPMFSGCLTVAVIWLINACFVFRASGIAAPLWFPAAAFALLLASFQALAWTPFAQRWLHIALTTVVLTSPILVLLVGLILNLQLSEPMATCLLLGLIPIAYVAAVSGVGRARRGEAYDWRAWGRFVESLAKWRPAVTHPFRSIGTAQLWYECRAHLIVPVFIACLMPCLIFVPALAREDVALGWRLLAGLLFVPLMVAGLAGGALGNLTDPISKSYTASFVLVRPISSLSILRVKLATAAIMTGAIWLLFLGYISLLLTRPGFPQSIAQVASSAGVWKAIGYPILALSLLVLLTWKNMVASLWVTLTGRKWVEQANSFGFIGLVFIGIGIGLWVGFHPELHQPALAAVPWLIGLLLVMKLAAAGLVVRGLVQSRLTGPAGAALMVAMWLAAVGSLCALALFLLPPEYAAPKNVIPGIALFSPFSRLAGAPLALEWNRHR